MYRRDQIPACTLADCLRACPEYPIKRVVSGVPFVNPVSIPQDDPGFTAWYRRHARRFFAASGREYEALFATHGLEHKACGEPARVAFDGLCCDGASNYLKLLKVGDTWAVADFKARSFRAEAKEKLAPWVLETYRHDRCAKPPPITESTSLCGYEDAVSVARLALPALESKRPAAQRHEAPAEVLFPLGLERRRVQAYKVIKSSAFVFRTPGQRERIVKAMQKFSDACGCGLEVLALRRGYGGRDRGSICDIAKTVYDYIRSGGDNLTKELNLTRPFKGTGGRAPTALRAAAGAEARAGGDVL